MSRTKIKRHKPLSPIMDLMDYMDKLGEKEHFLFGLIPDKASKCPCKDCKEIPSCFLSYFEFKGKSWLDHPLFTWVKFMFEHQNSQVILEMFKAVALCLEDNKHPEILKQIRELFKEKIEN